MILLKISKNLVRYKFESNFLKELDHQNNYVRNSNMMSDAANNFDILAINLNVLSNYFDSLFKVIFISVSN